MQAPLFGPNNGFRDKLNLFEMREGRNLSEADLQHLKMEFKDWQQLGSQRASTLRGLMKSLFKVKSKTPQ
jgi:hypothetical protein